MKPNKINNFITKRERTALVKWAYSNSENMTLNSHGPFRQYCRIRNSKNNKLALTIEDRISDKFSLKKRGLIEEPVLGSILSVINPGGFVHRHTAEGEPQYRFNLMVQLPTTGGIPTYDDDLTFSVEERDLLCYRPDLFFNGTTTVEGEKDRIIISYGWLKHNFFAAEIPSTIQ